MESDIDENISYYDMENADQIKIQYNIIDKNKMDLVDIKLRLLSTPNIKGDFVYENLLKRQNNIRNDIYCTEKIIEQLKIPTFISQINNYLSENKSVIIFVKYAQTLKILANKLNTDCIIYEGLSEYTITNSINNFEKDISRIIMCTYKLAIGFTLEYNKSNFPRVVIMSGIVPDYMVGRINWVKSKTSTKQVIMFCKRTQEEDMCDEMKRMLTNEYY